MSIQGETETSVLVADDGLAVALDDGGRLLVLPGGFAADRALLWAFVATGASGAVAACCRGRWEPGEES